MLTCVCVCCMQQQFCCTQSPVATYEWQGKRMHCMSSTSIVSSWWGATAYEEYSQRWKVLFWHNICIYVIDKINNNTRIKEKRESFQHAFPTLLAAFCCHEPFGEGSSMRRMHATAELNVFKWKTSKKTEWSLSSSEVKLYEAESHIKASKQCK